MPQVVQDLAPYLNSYGYLAVLGAILLEDFGVPMPGKTMLIAGSLFAALGHLNIAWVLTLAFTGAVLGTISASPSATSAAAGSRSGSDATSS